MQSKLSISPQIATMSGPWAVNSNVKRFGTIIRESCFLNNDPILCIIEMQQKERLYSKVYNEQVQLHGRTQKAVTETIRICKDRNVLKEFLTSREKEVITIMMTLFDEERIIHAYVAEERREAAEESVRKAAEKMLKAGKMSVEEIASYFSELSVEDIREIEKGMQQ